MRANFEKERRTESADNMTIKQMRPFCFLSDKRNNAIQLNLSNRITWPTPTRSSPPQALVSNHQNCGRRGTVKKRWGRRWRRNWWISESGRGEGRERLAKFWRLVDWWKRKSRARKGERRSFYLPHKRLIYHKNVRSRYNYYRTS